MEIPLSIDNRNSSNNENSHNNLNDNDDQISIAGFKAQLT